MPNNKNSFSTKAKCPKNCRLQIKSGGCHIVTEGQWIGHNREQEIFRTNKFEAFLIESLHQSVKCMIDAVKSLELG